MTAYAKPEHDLKRLCHLLAHFIDHAETIVQEIRKQRKVFSPDARLSELLERATTDVNSARSSLGVVLNELGGDVV